MKNFKVRPVDMCIYIDKHIYEPDHDVALIFEYLQNLFYSLAMKQRFFNNEEDYENYSLYGATQAYMRLTNKKQFDKENPLPKVKSILNWIKNVLYPFKVNYQKDNFKSMYIDEIQGDGIEESIMNGLQSNITKDLENLLEIDITSYFKDLPKTIFDFIKDNTYYKDKIIIYNIYLSCLFTLLRSVTLSNVNKERLLNNPLRFDAYIDNMYYQESLEAPIVWHLPAELKDYIAVLTNKIKKLMCENIKYLIKDFEPPQEVIKDILLSPLSNYEED